MDRQLTLNNKVVLITGAAKRIGAQTVRTLHKNGARIILHYRQSSKAAKNLADELNTQRKNSVFTLQADLLDSTAIESLAAKAFKAFNQLDILINNASSFFPTPIGKIKDQHFDDLIGSNLKAPLFLSQACVPYLKSSQGQIINMVDIHARKPLKDHIAYSCAKAANAMLVRSLALELGPDIRVNGISPGAILWPEDNNQLNEDSMAKILNEVPLNRTGKPEDIADTILFLIQHDYINGQIIAVDGGRQLF